MGSVGPEAPPPLATLPSDPIQQQPTLAGAQAAFDAQPPIRVLFDNGAGNSNPGWPYPGFRAVVLELPPSRTPRLARGTSRREAVSPTNLPPAPAGGPFTWDANARQLTNFTGDTASGPGVASGPPRPNYQWSQDPNGTAVLLHHSGAEAATPP